MRIAHVSATFPPYFTGTGNVCFHNARVLAERGHDVHVLTADWPGQRDDPPGVTVHRFRPLLRVGNAPVLPQLLRRRRFDLVHVHYPFYSGAEFTAVHRTPTVITYHQDVQLPGPHGLAARAHGRTVGRLVLSCARRLCFTTLDYARSSAVAGVARRLRTRVVELPNGVDTARFVPGPIDVEMRRKLGVPDDACVVTFVGSMDRAHYFKGVPVLLNAVAALPGMRAILVGDGDLRSAYEDLSRHLRIADRVVFAGRVAPDILPRMYRAGDIAALPSETSGEAFGLALIEAMACGRPVIGANLPGVRTVVRHEETGLLAVPGSQESLVLALRRLRDMPARERDAMGQSGRARVESHYAWDRIGDRLEAIYEAALQPHRSDARSRVIA